MLTCRPVWMRGCIRFCLGGNKWISTSRGGTATSNGNIFLRSSSQLMGCWVISNKSYLLLWVNSWTRKWKNQFRTLRFWLTSGWQSWLRGWSPGCSAELGFQVPYVPGIQTGSQVSDWAWHNKFPAPNYFCAHLSKLIHLNPPLPIVLINSLCPRNTPHPPQRTDSMEITDTYPDEELGVKNRPSG